MYKVERLELTVKNLLSVVRQFSVQLLLLTNSYLLVIILVCPSLCIDKGPNDETCERNLLKFSFPCFYTGVQLILLEVTITWVHEFKKMELLESRLISFFFW